MELVSSEEQLVHPHVRYGGTIDFVAKDRSGYVVLGDIKTTKANRDWPYPTVVAQVAAYSQLWQEHSGAPVDRHVVVRVGKTEDDPGQQVWLTQKQIKSGTKLFLAAMAAYEAQREL